MGILIVSAAVAEGTTEVAAVMLVMLRSLTYGQGIQATLGSLKSSLPRLELLDTSIDRYAGHPAPVGAVPLDRVGTIEFRAVSFGYAGDRDVLRRREHGDRAG